jgi:Lhr-like helicase
MRYLKWCDGLIRSAISSAKNSTKSCACCPDGFTTRRGRRGTYLHHDAVNQRIRGRRGARLSAITNGGAIPDTGDYRVILEPSETFVGTPERRFCDRESRGRHLSARQHVIRD